jgi:hypothetical protein
MIAMAVEAAFVVHFARIEKQSIQSAQRRNRMTVVRTDRPQDRLTLPVQHRMSTFLAYLECKFNSYFCYALPLEFDDDPGLNGLLVGCDGSSQTKSTIPVVRPKGLPADLDVVLRKLANVECATAHHHSWLTQGEVEKVRQRFKTEYDNTTPLSIQQLQQCVNPS